MRVRLIAAALAAAGVLGTSACAADADPSFNAAGNAGPVSTDPAPLTRGATGGPATSAPGKAAKLKADPKPAPARPRPSAPKPKPKLPTSASLDFTARTVTGASFSGATLAGKPTVLWFWAPWCPTCHGQVPDVLKAAKQNPGVNVVGVAGLDRAAPIKKFVDDKKITAFTNLSDVSGDVWKHFGVKAQGTYVLIDAKGAVSYTGYIWGSQLQQKIAKLG